MHWIFRFRLGWRPWWLHICIRIHVLNKRSSCKLEQQETDMCSSLYFWRWVHGFGKRSWRSSLVATPDDRSKGQQNRTNADVWGRSVCYLYGKEPSISWMCQTHWHQVPLYSRVNCKWSHRLEILQDRRYGFWHIQDWVKKSPRWLEWNQLIILFVSEKECWKNTLLPQ